jgi:hypothetical protein
MCLRRGVYEDIGIYDAEDCERGYEESRAMAGWMVRMEGVFVGSVDSNRRWGGSVGCLSAFEGGIGIPRGEVYKSPLLLIQVQSNVLCQVILISNI